MSRQTISSPFTLANNEILLALQNKHNFVHRCPFALPAHRHCGNKIAVLKHARKKCFGGRQSSSTNIRNLKDVFKKVVRMNDDDVKYRFNHFIHNSDYENNIVPLLYKQIQVGYKINDSSLF